MTSLRVTSAPPIGWSRGRYTHCYKPVLPSADKITGKLWSDKKVKIKLNRLFDTSQNQHDNLLVIKAFSEINIREIAQKIAVERKQKSVRVFSADRWPINRNVQAITNRLSYYDPILNAPPESKGYFNETSFSRPISRNQDYRENNSDCSGSQPFSEINGRSTPNPNRQKNKKTYTSRDVKDIVDRLSTYDPAKVPESRGYQIKLDTPLSLSTRQYSRDEIEDIVQRLSEYDPEKWPAESKGVFPDIPAENMTRPEKRTASDVQDMVDRLCEKDPLKWPPEARKNMIKVFTKVFVGQTS